MLLKRSLKPLLLAFAISGFSWSAQEYKIESGWSQVDFSVKNFGIHTVYGQFKTYAGTISYDDLDITKSSVTVSIQAASVDTDLKKRDEHLRTADFFDIEKTPEITFQSQRIMKRGEAFIMIGSLTIKGHTQQIELPFTYSFVTSSDGKTILHAQAQGSINRHDFGLDYGSNFSVGKEVKITINIQALPE